MKGKIFYSTQDELMRKFIEENIEEMNSLNNVLLSSISACILFFDKNYEVVMSNSKTLELYGFTEVSQLKTNLMRRSPQFQLDGKSSAEKFKFMIDEAFDKGYYETEWTHYNSNEELIKLRVTLILTNANKPKENQYILVLLQDMGVYTHATEKDIKIVGMLKAVIDANPLCLNLWNKNYENILCNKKAVELFSLENEEQYLNEFFKLSPEYQPNGKLSSELAAKQITKAFATGYSKFSWLHCNLKGEEIPAEITLCKIKINDEEVVAGFTRDLRHEFIGDAVDNQYENYFFNKVSDKTLLNVIAELSSDWFFALDTRTSVIQYYGRSVTGNGYKNGISVDFGVTLKSGHIHPDDVELYRKLTKNMLKGIYEPIDIRYKQKDDTFRYYRLVYKTIRDIDSNPIFVVGKGLDIHDQKILEERAKVDLLTGCYNKISAENIITEKIMENKEQNHALFIVDIDNFKAINDNLGHFFGDEVLKEVSKNLKNSFRSHDIVARIGGDEFIVFLENISNVQMLEKKAQTIVDAFKKTYSGDYKDYSISGSVGIAMYPTAGDSYNEIYKSADKALYQAKLQGKNQFVFYDETLVDGTMRNLTKLENANRIAGSFFDYDLISATFDILYERSGDALSVNQALRYVCQKYNADRCFIFETPDNGETYNNTFEWCNNGISKEINNLQKMPKSLFKDLFDAAQGGIVYSNDMQTLFKTDAAYEVMAKQNIKSFLHAQIRKDNNVNFILGLDDCTKGRVWSEKEINSLQYIAKVISIIRQGEHLREEVKEIVEYNKISAYVADHANDIVYMSDIENYELYYLNKEGLNLVGATEESQWKGKKCYKLLQGKDAPCEFCTNHLLNYDNYYEWTYTNPVFNKTYLLKDKLVKTEGETLRLEIATDITKLIELENELKEKLEEERLLINCIETLHSGEDPQTSIYKLLGIVAGFHEAERCYIFDVDEDGKTVTNTFEWCAEGVIPQIDNLQQVPKDAIQSWFDKYETVGEFYIDSVSQDLTPESPEYEIISSQGINSLVTAPIKDMDGVATGFIGVDNPKQNLKKTVILRSVSKFISNFLDETELLSELGKLSYFDTLTGVKNRHSYRKILKRIDRYYVKSLGVAYIDIKGLSSINEVNGTQYGDNVIIKLANTLKNIFVEDIFRVGGDEFVVLCKNIDEQLFENKIKELKDILSKEDFKTTIGYTWNKNYSTEETHNMETGEKYSKILSANLDKEIASGKFLVYLQPQIDIKTGEFSGAEALIRRKGADGFVQPPISFIPFYEKEGIISKIDLFVLETVCIQLEEWKKIGVNKDIRVSVNCSRITVTEENIVQKFCNIASKYAIDKSQIVVEITETINGVGDDVLADIIDQFSTCGFSVSLDDFGSGYSNLSSLMVSNFDELKLDMSLINNLHNDEKSRKIIKSALNLCDELTTLVSVAEGIEHYEQYQILKEMNCNKGQGYFFDKPMPIEDFTKKYIKGQKE